jgi:5-formyltetrahydrofolate cyclo-ligase
LSNTANPDHSNQRLKSRLRMQLRSMRRSLCARERADAERRICTNLHRVPAFVRADTVAAYLAFDGEPSISRLFTDVRNFRKRFLVPVIRSRAMKFAPLRDGGIRRNGFGIAEPMHRERAPTAKIDIVLVPLVGFDEAGNRLGMGGGYYDRHFSYLRIRKHYFRPRLIGVAYESQCISEIPVDPWDVALWGIVTEQRFRKIQREPT